MTDQQPTTPLSEIARTDQAVTELNAVIGPIAAAYRMLAASGMPDEDAAIIARVYGMRLIDRQFGPPAIASVHVYNPGEDD